MWAFMPASANWSGAMSGSARRAKSTVQARGADRGSRDQSSKAAKKRLAKTTSRRVMKAASAKKSPPMRRATSRVTVRYMRVKQATPSVTGKAVRSEEHTSELQSRQYLVCRLLLEKKKKRKEHTAVALFLCHIPP